ncbi:Fis Family transcriptional regulator NifA [Gluconacetobacter johannae DSM 13595]|uniref:Nif-specific regulatory protein n=1 Tax=Gluconacetobacter johannae TaxID=112140 RepID=A0A7W4J6J1_9PROT|nr:nif-specific transcriptional activator NifA [Gluconacetobacter johannae]MBB2175653.1 nif-specific transcriptional activator NifA [Gluconacetobacter johannae]GBQ86160.1 Fis Family transcriptional regulator NifA [Gluconacetobacter johannae DSM 13595]
MPTENSANGSGLSEHGSSWAHTALFGLHEISKILCAPIETTDAIRRVLTVLEGFVDMNNGVVVLFDDAQRVDTTIGAPANQMEAVAYFSSMPEQAIGHIVTSRMPLIVPDVALDRAFGFSVTPAWGVAPGKIGLIGVPIIDRGRVTGILIIDRSAMRPDSQLTDLDVRLLSMVAGLIGHTVRLHRMVRQDREYLLKAALTKERKPEAISSAETGIIGESAEIQSVIDKIQRVAKRNVTVLLRGESGTGKELFSRAVHAFSPRSNAPFVTLNCAALPESVLESELFGHEKGAFTGALSMRKGRFEMADGGTLFLDEIGEISASFQAKLLRVLQEGEFERVGGTRTLKVDVRIVAATNRNLEDAVSKGLFRADLYYRLSVIPIFLPPLRDRPSDIPLLAEEFLRHFNEENHTRLSISSDGLDVLSKCYFPGNVRELENCIRRTATLANGPSIRAQDFSCKSDGCLSSIFSGSLHDDPPMTPSRAPVAAPQDEVPLHTISGPADCPSSATCALGGGERPSQKQELIDAMETAGWVQAKAARILGMTPRQVGYALRKNGISIRKF